MDKTKKQKSLRANIPETEKREFEHICSILDVPEAQIIRESLREKIEFLKANNPKVREALLQN